MANNKDTGPTAAELAAQKAKDAEAAAPAKAKAAAEKGELHVAVNLIVQTGKDGKSEDVLPGTTFYPAKADIAFLKKHDAIREPTEQERVMHAHVEKLQSAAAASADETLG